MSSDDRVVDWLSDIVENIDRISGYVANCDREAFMSDLKTRDAVERCIERIVEAVTRIGADRMAVIAPQLPIHKMRGLGNRLRHEYDYVDPIIIWDTVHDELPELRAACVAVTSRRS